MILAEDRDGRLAYPIPEVARKLGLHRRTIEYKIKAGKLDVVEFFGKRLVTAESLRAALIPATGSLLPVAPQDTGTKLP